MSMKRKEQELDEELRAYLDIAIDEQLRAHPSMTREEATRAARMKLGGLETVKERVRDEWWESIVFSCAQDVRYALRTLRKTPAFTTVAILTLALGIGANTAIFSVVDSLLLRTLPVVEPRQLVTVTEGTTTGPAPWSYPIWEQIRDRAQLFDGAVAFWSARFDLAQGGEVQPADGLFVSGEYFSTLGVPALLGRTFTAGDDRIGGGPDGPIAIISYGMWQRRFGGAANIIGTPIVVDRVPCTIVGVTPPAFFGAEVGRAFDIALPIGLDPVLHGPAHSNLNSRRSYWLTIMLRLKPTQSIDTATAILRGEQPQIRLAAMPQDRPADTLSEFMSEPLSLVPAATGISPLRQRYERPLLTLLVVVAIVLLIACANLANLLLARAAARRSEVSLRLALGGSRGRLVRQLLIESLVLAVPGAALGVLLAIWASRALVAQLSTATSRVVLGLAIDWRLIAFTTGITIATTLLFGAAPAWRAARVEPIEALKDQRRAATRGRGHLVGGTSNALVILQIALSLVLVVIAGLFVRTFQQLATVPLGFDSDRVLVINVDISRAQGGSREALAARPAFFEHLIETVRAIPGVSHASASTVTPVSGLTTRFPVDVPGGATLPLNERRVRANSIAPDWLATYGMSIRAGRDVDAHDTASTPQVVLVNEAFVRKFLPGPSAGDDNPARAIGRTMIPAAPPGAGDTASAKTIVGVVSDSVYRSVREGVEPTVYGPIAQEIPRNSGISLSVRAATGSPAALASSIATALSAVDRNLSFSFRPLTDQVQASFAQERLVALLSGFFGALALLLAGLGLYGVTAYAATRRRAEIGIRIALGATRAKVIALVLRRSLIVTTIGIAVGLALAAAVTRYLEGMLFGLTPLDPITFVAVSALFAAVTLLAAFLPARRATVADPLEALRHE
jgi:putative ABC transport system permease protein